MTSKPCPTAVIADDEPLLLFHLDKLLGEVWPELEIVAKASDGALALEAIQAHQPDVAFLDIRMPKLDGMSVAKKLTTSDKPPLVVFTTAYDEYAVQAFEHAAVDYVLKPLSDERLAKACQRVRERLEEEPAGNVSLDALFEQLQQTALQPPKQYLSWLRASRGEDIHLIAIEDVAYFHAEDKYISVYVGDSADNLEEYVIRSTLKELSGQLNPECFWQIHRSTIINVARVEKVKKEFTGKMNVIIAGRKLPVSRACQNLFKVQ